MIEFVVLFFLTYIHISVATVTTSFNDSNILIAQLLSNTTINYTVTSISENGYTYQLRHGINIEADASLVTIDAQMSFEDPVDDIEESTSPGFGVSSDYQTIGKKRVESILDSVFNETYEYIWSSSAYNHYFKNGTARVVTPKQYPLTTACSCTSLEDDPTWGLFPDSTCDQSCLYYNCEYQGTPWAGGECEPLMEDSDIDRIMENYNTWYTRIQKTSGSTWILNLAWGYYEGDDSSYPSAWWQSYYSSTGSTQRNSITCSGGTKPDDTYYWNNGWHNGRTKLANTKEYRRNSYSTNSVSSSGVSSISVTIKSNGQTVTKGSDLSAYQSEMNSFLSDKRLIMFDVGLSWKHWGILSNNSEWKFVDDQYFGYGCNQMMISNYNWYNGACSRPLDGCMNYTYAKFSYSDYGIASIPNSDALSDAFVTTNISTYSEDNITLRFLYGHSVAIPDSMVILEEATACNFNPSVTSFNATHTTAAATFDNCGNDTSNFHLSVTCNSATSHNTSSNSVANGNSDAFNITIACTHISDVTLYMEIKPLWDQSITNTWTQHFTTAPTMSPSTNPSVSPTRNPSTSPTLTPSMNPSMSPTFVPSMSPSMNPSMNPSMSPTLSPSMNPSTSPTANPSSSPSTSPSMSPSMTPSMYPSQTPTTPIPSRHPIPEPTATPSMIPSNNPSVTPSFSPSLIPSDTPTVNPFKAPTSDPTSSPTQACFWNTQVTSSSSNSIIHGNLCETPITGGFIIEMTDLDVYYVSADSSGTQTYLKEISISNDNTYTVGSAFDASKLVGYSIEYYSDWISVLSVLDLEISSDLLSDSEVTYIRFTNISLSNDLSTTLLRTAFKSAVKSTLVGSANIDSSYISISDLSSGSVIAEVTIDTSNANDTTSATQVLADINNFVASSNGSNTGNISNPFASVDSFYINGESNDIVFTYCPGVLYYTSNDKKINVNWTTPTARSSNSETVTITQLEGTTQGSELTVGSSDYIKYSATATGSDTNYCEFVIVTEKNGNSKKSWLNAQWKGTILIIIVVVCVLCFGIAIYQGMCRQQRLFCICGDNNHINSSEVRHSVIVQESVQLNREIENPNPLAPKEGEEDKVTMEGKHAIVSGTNTNEVHSPSKVRQSLLS